MNRVLKLFKTIRNLANCIINKKLIKVIHAVAVLALLWYPVPFARGKTPIEGRFISFPSETEKKEWLEKFNPRLLE